MLRGILVLLACAVVALAGASPKPNQATTLLLAKPGEPQANTGLARLRVGDEIAVIVAGLPESTGSYSVQSDGYLYLPRLGKFRARGLNLDELTRQVTTSAAKFLKRPQVSLVLKRQRPVPVYVIGGKAPANSPVPGGIELTGKMGLREVYALASGESEADQINVSLFRAGKRLGQITGADLIAGKAGSWATQLEPEDVVVIEPKPFLRVWVTGAVKAPGKVRLTVGDDLYRAIAAAGDLSERPDIKNLQRSDFTVTLRRGPEQFEFPLVPDLARAPFVLEEGDTISVQPVQLVRVTLSGEVKRPGESIVVPRTTVSSLLASSGGITPEGTAKSVLLFRKGEVLFVDAVPPKAGEAPAATPKLEDGDVLFVPKSERVFYVYGEVARAGRFLMLDERIYRLSDVLAEAGGLNGLGTFRRVSIVRKGSGDRLVATQYNLDEYLLDGKLTSNPEIQPRDVIVFDRSRGTTINQILNLTTSLLFLQTLIQR